MADESEKPPVTDSRFPGFNPEVEQSHAEELERLEAEAARKAEEAANPPPPPIYTHRCTACGYQLEAAVDPCTSCGASGTMQALKHRNV